MSRPLPPYLSLEAQMKGRVAPAAVLASVLMFDTEVHKAIGYQPGAPVEGDVLTWCNALECIAAAALIALARIQIEYATKRVNDLRQGG